MLKVERKSFYVTDFHFSWKPNAKDLWRTKYIKSNCFWFWSTILNYDLTNENVDVSSFLLCWWKVYVDIISLSKVMRIQHVSCGNYWKCEMIEISSTKFSRNLSNGNILKIAKPFVRSIYNFRAIKNFPSLGQKWSIHPHLSYFVISSSNLSQNPI